MDWGDQNGSCKVSSRAGEVYSVLRDFWTGRLQVLADRDHILAVYLAHNALTEWRERTAPRRVRSPVFFRKVLCAANLQAAGPMGSSGALLPGDEAFARLATRY